MTAPNEDPRNATDAELIQAESADRERRTKRLRSLEDTDDGIDEAGWERKVRELPDWDRCEDDGGGVATLDLSDPENAPFGLEWRLSLVNEKPTVCLSDQAERDRSTFLCSLPQIDPTASRPPALATGHDPTPLPTAAGDRPAEEHQGAVDHHGPAAPAHGHAAPGFLPSLKDAKLSEACAQIAVLGLMDPREVVGIAAVEEHVERWHGDEIEPSPMRLRAKTKADRRVVENIRRFRRPLEIAQTDEITQLLEELGNRLEQLS